MTPVRTLLLALAACAALLAPAAAAPAASAQTPACSLTEDANGNLAVTGSGLEPSYYWGWALYAQGVTPPAGYTPWVDYGYSSSDASGGFSFTMGSVTAYEAFYPGLGPYPLQFDVFDLHGSKDLIGTNRLTNGTGYLASCTFTP